MSTTASQYTVIELSADAKAKGFSAYGGGRDLWKCKDFEQIISGPAETGKTITCLQKLHALCCKYPNAQALIVRKTYKSMKTSVLRTYEKKVLLPNSGVVVFGGDRVEHYDYPNGSQIFVAGMDSPDKILSSEWDYVYINQCEELNLEDYETITTRTTGRSGNVPYPLIIADCNPGGPQHWLLKRRDDGKLTFIESRHEDNPILFDPTTHTITEQGKKSLAILDNLTGVRYLRLRKGKWAGAEGMIYEDFDRSVHIIQPFRIPDDWPRIRVIDFGYTNPFVCQWWAIDGDGRLYLYREIYMSRKIVDDHAAQINQLSIGENIIATIADHDAEDRATLARCGIETIPAMKAVSLGIQAVQKRMRKAGDDRPRIYILSDALVEADPVLIEQRLPLCTEQEIEGYTWVRTKDGLDKETPEKKNDHGCDAARYLVTFVDDIRPADDVYHETVIYDDYDYQISPI